jgi:hypothetical protein
MKNNAKFYRQIIALIGIALIVAGSARTSRADDGRDFATKSKFTTIDFPGANGTSVFGINPQGDIVGTHFTFILIPSFTLNEHGFLLGKGKTYQHRRTGGQPQFDPT